MDYQGSTPHKDILQNDNPEVFSCVGTYHCHGIIITFDKVCFCKVILQSMFLEWIHVLPPSVTIISIQNSIINVKHVSTYNVCRIPFSALKNGHPLVGFFFFFCMRWKCGRLASHNACITQAIRQDLDSNWNITAVTVHDEPKDSSCGGHAITWTVYMTSGWSLHISLQWKCNKITKSRQQKKKMGGGVGEWEWQS